jgi:cellulose synthase/poly-beta-1,6-N-acetylglucosamine synthase-like glycosyltransferase
MIWGPLTLAAWFHQRKRWSRGWMQIARLNMARIPAAPIPVIKKYDIMIALISSLAAGLLISLFPLLALTILGFQTSCFTPTVSLALWLFVTSTPPILSILTQWLDIRYNKPDSISILLSPLLILYCLALFGVSWLAFVDEFLFARDYAYIKTERTQLAWENV